MKRILILSIILVDLLFVLSCTKSTPENHGDLSGLPSFEYQGYTYYIHDDLGKSTYSDATQRVSQLSSYGYTSWFMPKIDELSEASKHGLIKVISEENDWENRYWSSSTSASMMWVLEYYNSNWRQTTLDPQTHVAWTLPMLRLRKN